MIQRRTPWRSSLCVAALFLACSRPNTAPVPDSPENAAGRSAPASADEDELTYWPTHSPTPGAPQAQRAESRVASSGPAPATAPVPLVEQEAATTRAAEPQREIAADSAAGLGQGRGARLAPKEAKGVHAGPAQPSLRMRSPVGSGQPGWHAPPLDQEEYTAGTETPFARVSEQPLSTFSIDVDTASYSNVRRLLRQGQLPPSGAVRVEEMINYFPYDYAQPRGDEPFALRVEVSEAPWNRQHRLLHIGMQGERIEAAHLPPRNLVFLLDVSGSMSDGNKLPLLKSALATLTETLRPQDEVAIAVYAGASGLVLPPTRGSEHTKLFSALDRLEAGGSTNGASGIRLAYEVARGMAEPGSSTRVILATDGDFNVGVTSQSELYQLIEDERRSGVFLSVLGFGMGNYKDSTLELLADKGNGNYAYVDSLREARKVLVQEGGATLHTIAKDVKLQIEFNPAHVAAYRLIGYENRRLAARDFNDDQKDAGELGAGHSVTALYELIPPGVGFSGPGVDALRYQQPAQPRVAHVSELATLKLRYKLPNQSTSRLLAHAVRDSRQPLERTSDTFRFSAAVAAFGMTLTGSPERGSSSFELARSLAQGAMGRDEHGYRAEFLSLVSRASSLSGGAPQRSSGLVDF